MIIVENLNTLDVTILDSINSYYIFYINDFLKNYLPDIINIIEKEQFDEDYLFCLELVKVFEYIEEKEYKKAVNTLQTLDSFDLPLLEYKIVKASKLYKPIKISKKYIKFANIENKKEIFK